MLSIKCIEEQEQSHGATTSRPKSSGIRYNCPLGALDKSTLRYNLLPKSSPISPSLPSRERAMLLSNQQKAKYCNLGTKLCKSRLRITLGVG